MMQTLALLALIAVAWLIGLTFALNIWGLPRPKNFGFMVGEEDGDE